MVQKSSFSRDEIKAAMRKNYDVLISFVTSEPFRNILCHMNALADAERDRFITTVLLVPEKLKDKGVVPPDGVLIQRSAFGDRRPTLFCVKKYLPPQFQSAWENVNITFDAKADETVSRDPKVCWRNPLRPDLQAALLAAGLPLEEIPASLEVSGTLMRERWNAAPETGRITA